LSIPTSDPEFRLEDSSASGHQNRAELVHMRADGKIIRKNVLRTTTLIGSHEQANLQLLAKDIEASHCVITLDGRGLRIWDLRTESGTYVNEQRIKSARLRNGDFVRIGKFLFELETNLEDRTRQGFYIDEYRVVGILGTGGMGWLYVVEESRSMQMFALKVLTRMANTKDVEQDELRTRFMFEGRAGDMLRHPNIVEVVDYQHRPDVEYLLLELFESINLQEMIQRDRRVAPHLCCHVIRQAALGLAHIHEAGLVHRDVKPANILVGHDGSAKICDFGLVFIGNDPEELKLAEQMGNDCLGTADFISPEQSFDSYHVDQRSDIYSLGCSLYYALTGQVPFPVKNSREKIMGHRKSTPRAIRELNPDVPEEIAKIAERCLEKNPEDRFQTGTELADALEPFQLEKLHVKFDFEQILRKRANQASFRLADPKKKHYLQRIPANVASSLQAMSSSDRIDDDHTVLSEAPVTSSEATHIVSDTASKTELR